MAMESTARTPCYYLSRSCCVVNFISSNFFISKLFRNEIIRRAVALNALQQNDSTVCRGTSLIRKHRPLRPYGRPMPKALWGWRFLVSEVPLQESGGRGTPTRPSAWMGILRLSREGAPFSDIPPPISKNDRRPAVRVNVRHETRYDPHPFWECARPVTPTTRNSRPYNPCRFPGRQGRMELETGR